MRNKKIPFQCMHKYMHMYMYVHTQMGGEYISLLNLGKKNISSLYRLNIHL